MFCRGLAICGSIALVTSCAPEVEKTPEQLTSEAEVRFAKECAAILAKRDPVLDAQTAHRAGERRLLSWSMGSFAVDLIAPGIGCSAKVENKNPAGLPKLPLGYANSTDLPGHHEANMLLCFHANERYGSLFNKEMMRIEPNTSSTTCRFGEDGKILITGIYESPLVDYPASIPVIVPVPRSIPADKVVAPR